ncbi:hypothetical protein [Marinobacter sp. LV10MA510-1]|uniref:hypothetical protein n=1 Tax=Marinobacter sp. LV10MA510-1 TaxID=1415567 RepID=UPI000BF28625|nr:hypothetical protein [Marinobacter sp. LV10MA510-1]
MKSEMLAFQGLFKIDPAAASQRMLQGCDHDQPVVTDANHCEAMGLGNYAEVSVTLLDAPSDVSGYFFF